MKFAHLSDVHLGAWRDETLKKLNYKAFEQAISKILHLNLDFVIIAGDLFNNSFPSIDTLRLCVKQLKRLKDRNIKVYCVPGSHDFSPSGKSMLNVLEEAGLVINVAKAEDVTEYNNKSIKNNNRIRLKFYIDKEEGLAITGIPGRKLGLEKTYFDNLDLEYLEQNYKELKKIFVFHSCVLEIRPQGYEFIEAIPLSSLPKGFDYYASGHIHKTMKYDFSSQGYGIIAFPGALFPTNFNEIQENKEQLWGFYVYNDDTDDKVSNANKPKLDFVPINITNFYNISIDGNGKTAKQIEDEIISHFEDKELYDYVVTIKVSGTLTKGKVSDIDTRSIIELCYDKGACAILRNFSGLKSKEYEVVKIDPRLNIEEIKNKIIDETIPEHILFDDKTKTKELAHALINILSKEKLEGERNYDYENRLIKEFSTILSNYLSTEDNSKVNDNKDTTKKHDN